MGPESTRMAGPESAHDVFPISVIQVEMKVSSAMDAMCEGCVAISAVLNG